MKKCISMVSLLLALAIMLTACAGGGNESTEPSATGGQSTVPSRIGNPLAENREKLLAFDYDQVVLEDGLLKQTFDGCMEYYDQLTADDILYRWRKVSGMDLKTGRDLGWEAGTTNPECCVTQLISAKARRYAISHDEQTKQTVQDILDGYQEILDTTGSYPLIHSAYFYEKLLRAFLDCYEYCGLEQGYEMAKELVSYGMNNEPFKTPDKLLGDNGSEWYTMSEVLYMFASTAKEKGEPATAIKEYLNFAALYEYTEFWDIFYNEENLFDYSVQVDRPYNEWFHAYSHVNSFNSALEAYKQTGKSYYLEAAQKFYQWLEDSQKLATGGYGAQWEWLLPPELMLAYLRSTDRSTETQCNAYAIENMDRYLTVFTGEASYGQWTEDAMYNMTIASLETTDGCPIYYSDYSSDGGVKHLREDWPWACCAGTRPLSVMEYLRSIYYNDTKNIYVNLYTNASVEMTNLNGNTVKLTQSSDFPSDQTVTFTVNTTETEAFSVCFRKPAWLASDAVAAVNGETVALQEENGWLFINRTWKDADVVTLELPMELTYSTLYGADESDAIYAVKYGPVVLACEGVVENLSAVLPLDGNPSELLTQEDGLHFCSTADETVNFKPFYEYGEDEPYVMYISTK